MAFDWTDLVDGVDEASCVPINTIGNYLKNGVPAGDVTGLAVINCGLATYSGNNYTITCPVAWAGNSSICILFTPIAACGAEATFNVNGYGALKGYRPDGESYLKANDITALRTTRMVWDANNNRWIVLDIAALATTNGAETLTNKTLTSPKINEAVAVTTTSTEINLLHGKTSVQQQSITDSEGFYDTDTVEGALSQIGADKVYTAAQLKTLRDIVNLITKTNPAGEAIVSDSTYSIESLPVNAKNWFMPTVKLEGLTVKNLVDGKTFVNWLTVYATASVSNGVASVTGTGAGSTLQYYKNTGIACVTGKKIYARCFVQVTNAVATSVVLDIEGLSGGITTIEAQTTPIENAWYDLSGIVTLSASHKGNVVVNVRTGYADAATASGKITNVKTIRCVDLTALGFGGKTTSELDEMFPYYIDGLQSVTGTRIKGVSKNQLPLNANDWEQGTIDSGNGTEVASTTRIRLKSGKKLKVLPSTAYTISINSTYNIIVVQYDSIGNWLSTGSWGQTVTLTTASNTAYMRFVVKFVSGATILAAEILNTTPQLEYGSTATTYEAYQESCLYLSNETLRRVPNDTKDSIEMQSDGTFNKIQRVSTEYTLQASDITSLTTAPTNCDYVKIPMPSGGIPRTITENSGAVLTNFSVPALASWSDSASMIGTHCYGIGTYTADQIIYSFAKGTYATLAAAQAALAGAKIIYQLATPVITEVQVFGQLISKPRGTIYIDNILGDVGYYDSGITVSGVVFDAIEEVHKIDPETGTETDITSASTLTTNGFTSTGLSDGDLVWYALHIKDKPKGLCIYGYYDDTLVKIDSVDSKAKRLSWSVANGVITFTAVEV